MTARRSQSRCCMLKADRERGVRLGMQARNDVIGYYNWDRVAQETEAVLMDACG